MTALERVVARFPDRGTVVFEDGTVTGDAGAIAALEAQTGRVEVIICMNCDAEDYLVAGNEFGAAARALGAEIVESEGTRPIPPGDFFHPVVLEDGTLGSSADEPMAEYRREMRAWHKRRRELRKASS